MTDTPKLDDRTLDDVVEQTEALASALSPWQPQPKLDMGGALIRLFGRMVDQLLRQLDDVPLKHKLAFTNLLGARRISAQPARTPIEFTLTPGTGTSVVPAGTPCAATTDAGTITFETELDLALTRTDLAAVFVRDTWDPMDATKQCYADRTAIATGAASGAFDALGAAGATPIEHVLWVNLGVVSGPTTLEVVADAGAQALPATPIAWTVMSATGDDIALPTIAVANRWVVPTTPSYVLGTGTVDGVTSTWLRGELGAPTPSLAITVQLGLSGQAPADAALANGVKLDFSRDAQPFGAQPGFGDAFHVASDAALSIGGATVTLAFAVSHPGAPSNLVITWECWDGAKATQITTTTVMPSSLTFTVPAGGVAPTTIGGVTSRWIRARITAGNFGVGASVDSSNKYVAPTYDPPWIGGAAVSWTATVQPSIQLVRQTAQTFTQVAAGGAVYVATPELEYMATDDRSPALHLGFDAAFEPGVASLFLEVALPDAPASYTATPAPPVAPQLAWEYWNGAWTAFPDATPVDDGTQALSRSGLVRFVAPADATTLAQYGRTLYWLRARSLGGFSPMPRLARILTNTTWASHAHTVVDELLGASSGALSQTFSLAQTPVLDGQQIVVGEAEVPPPSELAAIVAAEGADAVDASGSPVWVRWHEVPDFLASGPRDRHYTFDPDDGEVTFGDGTNGMIPPTLPQNIRAARYRAGGGPTGNVPAGAVTQLKGSVPFVASIANVEPAIGGAAIETPDALMTRAATTLRHGGYAVTAQDFADLALVSSLAIARAVTITPSFVPNDQGDGPSTDANALHRDGMVIVVIVPAAIAPGQSPTVDTLATVRDYLVARCAPDATVLVTGPTWVWTDIVVHVAADSLADTEATLARVDAAIRALLDPVTGGDGDGWEFGRRPRRSDLIACITAVPGVARLTYLSIACGAPFDQADTYDPSSSGPAISFDQLSLYGRLLAWVRGLTVTVPGAIA